MGGEERRRRPHARKPTRVERGDRREVCFNSSDKSRTAFSPFHKNNTRILEGEAKPTGARGPFPDVRGTPREMQSFKTYFLVG